MLDELNSALRLYAEQTALNLTSSTFDLSEDVDEDVARTLVNEEALSWTGCSMVIPEEVEEGKPEEDGAEKREDNREKNTDEHSKEKREHFGMAGIEPAAAMTQRREACMSCTKPLAMTLYLNTMAGEEAVVTVPCESSTEHLMIAVEITLGTPARQQTLVSAGNMLKPGLILYDQGIADGSSITVIVSQIPERVNVRLTEQSDSSMFMSLSGSCGTYVRTDTDMVERPMYKRDASLSQWNTKLRYWGDGDRFLMYERHELGGRWVITDGREWTRYKDSSYAYVVSDAEHPGLLKDQSWNAFHNGKKAGMKWEPISWLDVREDSSRLLNVRESQCGPSALNPSCQRSYRSSLAFDRGGQTVLQEQHLSSIRAQRALSEGMMVKAW